MTLRSNLQSLLCQCRALKVLVHAKLLLQLAALLVCDGVLVLRLHASNKVRVIAQVKLGADKNDRYTRTVVAHLRVPLDKRGIFKSCE